MVRQKRVRDSEIFRDVELDIACITGLTIKKYYNYNTVTIYIYIYNIDIPCTVSVAIAVILST